MEDGEVVAAGAGEVLLPLHRRLLLKVTNLREKKRRLVFLRYLLLLRGGAVGNPARSSSSQHRQG